jgi:hypothetical protein
VLAALEAARLQARGAALQAGDARAAVEATEQRALAKAAATGCWAAGLQTAADRVRKAFAGYAALRAMRFPGPQSAWQAERRDPRLKGPRWTLVEALPGTGGWLLFGLVDGRPALLDARRGAAPAASAQIRLRDPARTAEPYLAGPPPEPIARTFIASARGGAAPALLPAGASTGVLYGFVPELAAALATLDPRESAAVALVYPAAGRERVYAARLEVGDFAAARAFLSLPAPP